MESTARNTAFNISVKTRQSVQLIWLPPCRFIAGYARVLVQRKRVGLADFSLFTGNKNENAMLIIVLLYYVVDMFIYLIYLFIIIVTRSSVCTYRSQVDPVGVFARVDQLSVSPH